MSDHDELARALVLGFLMADTTDSRIALVAQALAQVEREALERVLALPVCGSWIKATDIQKLAEDSSGK